MNMPPVNLRSALIRTGIAALAFLLPLFGPLSQSTAAGPGHKMRISVDDLVAYFDTIVFGSELDPQYAADVISRWQGPVRIQFQGYVTPQYREFVRTHLQVLSNLTRLEFSEVDSKDESPEIYLLFLPRDEMAKIPVPREYAATVEKAAKSANCYFITWKKPASLIVKSIIVADIGKDPAVLNSCLLEELTQSLGLPNDSDTLRPSVFSDQDRLYELSPQDRVLIHTLYHPRMLPGMAKKEALKTAREIISDLARRQPEEPSTSRAPGG